MMLRNSAEVNLSLQPAAVDSAQKSERGSQQVRSDARSNPGPTADGTAVMDRG
jgi:hypothetical protein